MNICKIWDSDYPWDVRVEKICNSFINLGHEVHIVCRNKNKIRPKYEYYKKIHIHRLPIINKKIKKIISYPFPFNPLWLYSIYAVVNKYKSDCIIVRDLPMAIAAIIIAKLKKIPCFIDMAEPYPEMLEGYKKLQKLNINKKIVNSILRNYNVWLIIERIACRYADHIFPVSKEIKNNLISKGICDSKITVVYNTPDLLFIQNCKITNKQKIIKNNNCLRIAYVGDLTEARGLPLVINAVERLNKINYKFNLTIIGSGRYENYLKYLVRKKNMENDIIFVGWVEHDKIIENLKNCDIGIIPHLPTKHNNLTIPNKVFDYMAIGLPILSGDLLPIKNILNETGAGLTFDYDSEDSISEKLISLNNYALRSQYGANGMNAVERKYNWNFDFMKLLSTISKYTKNPVCE